MHLSIRHELSKETKAKRGEVAGAKSRGEQTARCATTKDFGRRSLHFHSHHGHYLHTRAKASAKDRTQVGTH
jgi:hypothetical protein